VTHPLAGEFSVEASARTIRYYRYAEERMMRIVGGWIALTPELPAKLVFGRHVWDCAQHTDLLGRRLPELRSPAQQSEPPNERFVRFMDRLESPAERDQTPQRLLGVYRVLKPHLIAAYELHLRTASPIYEPPTCRILERLVAEERRHVAAGLAVWRHLGAHSAEWVSEVGDALVAAGGITGDGRIPAVCEVETSGVDPSRDLVAMDSSFDPDRVDPELRARVEAHARALVGGDRSALLVDVDGSVQDTVIAEYGRLPSAAETSELVGCARLGKYRVVKVRLTGRDWQGVAQQRWQPVEGGWRLAMAEVVAIDRKR